jgi:hypothetical protein
MLLGKLLGLEPRTGDQPVVVRAKCQFSEGEQATLLVSDLSLDGAFICSLRPPAIGRAVMVELEAKGIARVGPLKTRVIGMRVDPASAERSGFEVLFPKLTRSESKNIRQLLDRLGEKNLLGRDSRPSVPERRGQPRVDVDYEADVILGDGRRTFQMINLSMSGALLVVRGDRLPAELKVGAQIELTVFTINVVDGVPLRAEVVRVNPDGDPPNLAVRFPKMDDDTAALLESLMLYALVQRGLPTFPQIT